MSAEAIVMMVVAMLVLWGGLGVAVVRLSRSADAEAEAGPEPGSFHRDL